MTVATIIVNYNAGETLLQCVKALLNSSEATRLTLVDNASTDGSIEAVLSHYGQNREIEFLCNRENIGFAPAVNTAARGSDADCILILNPDCILEPDALRRLKEALIADSAAALAGPSVRDESGEIQRATIRRFPDPWKSLMTVTGLWHFGKWFPAFQGIEIDVVDTTERAISCDAVSGACMLIKHDALKGVGYLDEKYKMHCEDIDLMFRLKQQGWHSLYVPQASCVHQQGLSSRSRPSWVHFQKHRGMDRFFRKFQAKSRSLPIRALVITGIWLRFVILWPFVLIKR